MNKYKYLGIMYFNIQYPYAVNMDFCGDTYHHQFYIIEVHADKGMKVQLLRWGTYAVDIGGWAVAQGLLLPSGTPPDLALGKNFPFFEHRRCR